MDVVAHIPEQNGTCATSSHYLRESSNFHGTRAFRMSCAARWGAGKWGYRALQFQLWYSSEYLQFWIELKVFLKGKSSI